jgi:hypothetical protein
MSFGQRLTKPVLGGMGSQRGSRRISGGQGDEIAGLLQFVSFGGN